MVQFYTGVASGGFSQRFLYSGHADYLADVDFGKLAGWNGLSLKIRAEDHFGQSINGFTGAVVTPYLLEDTPPINNGDVPLTDFLFTQMLSKSVGIFAGKMDTLHEPNTFSDGRGDTQFSTSFILDPDRGFRLQIIPYSTLGGWPFHSRGPGDGVRSDRIELDQTSSTIGLNDLFRDGMVMVTNTGSRLPYQIDSLPGHQAFFGAWTNRTFTVPGQEPFIVVGKGETIGPVHGSWALFWNMDQYLFVRPTTRTGAGGRSPAPRSLTAGRIRCACSSSASAWAATARSVAGTATPSRRPVLRPGQPAGDGDHRPAAADRRRQRYGVLLQLRRDAVAPRDGGHAGPARWILQDAGTAPLLGLRVKIDF